MKKKKVPGERIDCQAMHPTHRQRYDEAQYRLLLEQPPPHDAEPESSDGEPGRCIGRDCPTPVPETLGLCLKHEDMLRELMLEIREHGERQSTLDRLQHSFPHLFDGLGPWDEQT